MKRERKASSVTTKQPNPKQSRLDTWAKKDTNMTQAGKSDPIVKSEEDDTLPSKKVKKTKELTLYGECTEDSWDVFLTEGGGGTIRFWPKFMAHKEAEELFQELNKSCEFTQSDVKVFNKVSRKASIRFFPPVFAFSHFSFRLPASLLVPFFSSLFLASFPIFLLSPRIIASLTSSQILMNVRYTRLHASKLGWLTRTQTLLCTPHHLRRRGRNLC